MRVEFVSYDRETNAVRVRSAVGVFSATWAGKDEPTAGGGAYIEFTTNPTAVWGVDITDATPEQPDGIFEDEAGWIFVGTILGIDPDYPYLVKTGRIIPEHDLEDGIFYLEIENADTIMMATDRLVPDAAGRRVRVRQTEVLLYPFDTFGYTVGSTKVSA